MTPWDGAKIVHSRYFTAVTRLTGGRGKQTHRRAHTGRTMSFEEKKREKENERGRQNSSLPEFNIVYRARKDEARAREREKHIPAHATVDV